MSTALWTLLRILGFWQGQMCNRNSHGKLFAFFVPVVGRGNAHFVPPNLSRVMDGTKDRSMKIPN